MRRNEVKLSSENIFFIALGKAVKLRKILMKTFYELNRFPTRGAKLSRSKNLEIRLQELVWYNLEHEINFSSSVFHSKITNFHGLKNYNLLRFCLNCKFITFTLYNVAFSQLSLLGNIFHSSLKIRFNVDPFSLVRRPTTK